MSNLLGDALSGGTGALLESLALALAFALIGYRMSVRHRVVRGVTPWRLPSFAWALICLVFQFIGLAVEILAELTTRPRSPLPTPPSRAVGEGFSPYLHSPGSAAGSAGIPGGVALLPETIEPLPDPRLAPPPGERPGQPPSFGWYVDPLGRHALRYFDGRRWGAEVVDGGTLSSDPL